MPPFSYLYENIMFANKTRSSIVWVGKERIEFIPDKRKHYFDPDRGLWLQIDLYCNNTKIKL